MSDKKTCPKCGKPIAWDEYPDDRDWRHLRDCWVFETTPTHESSWVLDRFTEAKNRLRKPTDAP